MLLSCTHWGWFGLECTISADALCCFLDCEGLTSLPGRGVGSLSARPDNAKVGKEGTFNHPGSGYDWRAYRLWACLRTRPQNELSLSSQPLFTEHQQHTHLNNFKYRLFQDYMMQTNRGRMLDRGGGGLWLSNVVFFPIMWMNTVHFHTA